MSPVGPGEGWDHVDELVFTFDEAMDPAGATAASLGDLDFFSFDASAGDVIGATLLGYVGLADTMKNLAFGGLGLALVAKLIRDHGGVVDASNLGDGTVFRVLLPLSTSSEKSGNAQT